MTISFWFNSHRKTKDLLQRFTRASLNAVHSCNGGKILRARHKVQKSGKRVYNSDDGAFLTFG